MALIVDKVSEDSFYENMLLGLVKVLENIPRIQNIRIKRNQPCTLSDLSQWEQNHGVILPDDVRSFYSSNDGFALLWSYEFCENVVLEDVGSIVVNSLSEIVMQVGCPCHCKAEVKIEDGRYNLYLGSESKVFELVLLENMGKVCLVYLTTKFAPTIWLVDTDLKWHYITDSFVQYFFMAIAHLGLPLWQFCLTPQGVPTWAETYFNIIAPHLLQSQFHISLPCPQEDDTLETSVINAPINKIDTNIFKLKPKAAKQKSTENGKNRKR